MFSENTQLQQSQVNGNTYASVDSYDTIARRQTEIQNIHAHVHEYGVITLKNSIEADKNVQVHVRWGMYSDLNPSITGTWTVSAFLESLHPGNTERIAITPDTTISLTPRHGSVDYEAWVKIPANTVVFTEHERAKPSTLVVVVTYNVPTFPAVALTNGSEALTSQPRFVLVTPLTYREPTGLPGLLTDTVNGQDLQFYIVV